MDWKSIIEHISTVQNLANNEEIRTKLESLSLYNSALKQNLDDTELTPEIQTLISKETELKDNTLAKIYDLQKQVEEAKTQEELAKKLLECFLYIDNYLSLYSEPELFFIQKKNSMHLCNPLELISSKSKFSDIIQSIFMFQELNIKTHLSIEQLCSFLRESKTNVFEFIDTVDYVVDKMDSLNRIIFAETNPDQYLKKLYPFILLANCTVQKLMLHRFTSNYPVNINKKVFETVLKQKEYVLDRIKGKLIKRTELIKQLREKFPDPLNQEIWYDERCINISDEEIIVKREEPESEGEATELIITTDKITRCCTTAYWIAFLVANFKKPENSSTNTEADTWLAKYLEASKNSKYEIMFSLHNFLLANKVQTSNDSNSIKISIPKKQNGSDSMFSKVMPLWLVCIIAAVISAAFVYFILLGTKNIIP